jgi:hypothetical protein
MQVKPLEQRVVTRVKKPLLDCLWHNASLPRADGSYNFVVADSLCASVAGERTAHGRRRCAKASPYGLRQFASGFHSRNAQPPVGREHLMFSVVAVDRLLAHLHDTQRVAVSRRLVMSTVGNRSALAI